MGTMVRAALALGSFDTVPSKFALEKGLQNDQIAPACQAALYKLTKDEKHLKAVGAVLLKKEYQGAYLLAKFLNAMKDDKARAVSEAWRAARKAEREKEKINE